MHQSIKKGIKMGRVLFLTLVGSMLFMSGCSDGKDEQSQVSEASASGIKVTKGVVKVDQTKEEDKQNSGKFYYSYNKKNNKEIKQYQSDTNKVRTTIDAYLNIRSPYEKVRITLMIKRLSKDYIIRCSPCHDDYANGVIGPSLLDKDQKFIYERIMDFKTGKKKNPLMRELVNQIPDEKLESIAKEIANFNKEIIKMRMGK